MLNVLDWLDARGVDLGTVKLDITRAADDFETYNAQGFQASRGNTRLLDVRRELLEEMLEEIEDRRSR